MDTPPLRPPARRVVGEFLHALSRADTYHPRRNLYILFGFLWGLPIPLFALGLHLRLAGEPFAVGPAISLVLSHPFHLVFLAHPILFAIVFGAMGSVRHGLDTRVEELLGRLRERARELDRANSRLRQIDRLKGEFLSNVTNEIRTPLGQARGNLEVLRSREFGPLNESAERILRNAERALDRLEQFLARLAGLIQLGASTRYDFESVDLAALARRILETLRPQLLDRRIEAASDGNPGARPVLGDESQLEDALATLLSEVMALACPGSRIDVRVIPAPDPEFTRLSVRLPGARLSERDVRFLADSYGEIDEPISEDLDGGGLALAIAAKVLRDHGGTLLLDGPPDPGTLFAIDLPAAPHGRTGKNPEDLGNSAHYEETGCAR